jgi:hypothetical protein
MSDSFRLIGLPYDPFAPLFRMDATQLREIGVVRCVASESSGFPCRVCLTDAEAGDELLLLSYEHQHAHSPYRASGPIFVKYGARRAVLAPGVIPPYVSSRLISIRAYDARHHITEAVVSKGPRVGADLEHLFSNPAVAYIHLHNANRGCFSCLAERVLHGA